MNFADTRNKILQPKIKNYNPIAIGKTKKYNPIPLSK